MKSEIALFEKLSDMIVIIDMQAKQISYMNQCAKQILRDEEDEKTIIAALLEEHTERHAVVQIGHMIYELDFLKQETALSSWILIGKIAGGILKSFDGLTGLATVDYFYELAGELVAEKFPQEKLTFVYFDVDNFKSFNSEYSYEEGDEFLCRLADLLTETFPKYLVGRTSNDHFIVLTNETELEQRINRIHEMTHRMQKNVKMELRAGIYVYEEGTSVAQCHDRAKIACDALRNSYNQSFRYYDKALREELLREKYITSHLDEAIEQEYLEVYYQPIRRSFSGKICAMESLVRWNDPQIGFLSPGEFIPILEKRHLIHKLDAFVLNRVCRDIIASEKLGGTVIPVSVNLSRLDFELMDVYAVFKDTTEKYGISPDMIHVEITESALNDDIEKLINVIDNLHEAGFEIWLDDFGSEYSSLNSLQNYHFDLLKIDMKFFDNFDTNEDARIIIASIIDMAKRLHMRVLAEGIETKEQYEFVRQAGCDKAQGFYICRPGALEALYGRNAEVETKEEAVYFSAIGRVNFLSPNPLEDDMAEEKIYNVIPTAIVEFQNNEFEYFYANKGFTDCLASMGVFSIEESQRIINDDSAKLKTRLVGVVQKSHANQRMESVDFIFHGQHVNVRAREIACTETSQALFVTMMNLSSMEDVRKIDQLETSLNFLYSIYDRVDLINMEEDRIENIYLSAHYYKTLFVGKNLQDSITEYANTDVASEDREKFLKFYDIATLEQRIAASGRDYIVRLIRTMTQKDGVHLQAYVIIRVNDGNSVRYLSCVRDAGEVYTGDFDSGIRPVSAKESRWYQVLSNELQASILEWNRKTGECYASGRAYQYALSHDRLEDIIDNNGNLETIYPEDIPIAMRFFQESRSGKKRAEAVLRLKMTDGSYRFSRVIGLFQHDKDGNQEYVIGIILDVEQEQNNLKQAKFLNMMPTALGVFEVQDGKTRQLFMNDGYYRLVQDKREHRNKVYKGFIQTIHPDDRAIVFSAIKSVIDGKQECSEVCRTVTGSGDYIWIRFTSSVAKRDQNSMLVYSTYVSVEDEQNNPTGPVENTDLLQLMCEKLNAVIFEVNLKEKSVDFSETGKPYALYHQSRESILNNSLDPKLVHPDDLADCMDFFRQMKGSGHSAEVTCRFLMVDGTYRFVRLIGCLNGDIATGIIVDVDSQMKRAREHEHLLNDIPGGVGIFDIKDGIATQRYMNDAYYRMVSDNREDRNERTENSFFNGVAQEDWPVIGSAINSLIDGESHVDFSYRAQIKNGSSRWLRLEGNVVWREEKHIIVYCSFSNVTEMYKKMEKQLKEVKRANEEKAEFYARMSHDMRTPMNGILGMTALSKGETDLDKLHYNIDMIESSGTYMLSLINDSLDMQRIENGKLTLMPQIAKADRFVDNIVSMITPTAKQKNIEFLVDNKNIDMNCYVRIDGVRFKQIFMNVLSNAIKFTPEGGTVRTDMECIKKEGNIQTDRFRIMDNGIGMSKDYLENGIFSAYKQEQNEMTTKYAGSGLGLAITKSLVELMGGSIEVDSILGKGSMFTLTFDIEIVPDEEAKQEQEEYGMPHMDESILEGKRILLFEDHPLNAEISARLLMKKGMLVEHAPNGKLGLEMFEQSKPGYYDAILMDIRMPVMDGLEAAAAIRALERFDAAVIPIIAMTANAYPEDTKRTKEAGMNAHLSKPVEPELIYSTLTELLT